MKKIAIFGAGGMGRETACIIRRINEKADYPVWNLIGFYDDGLPIGAANEFGSVLGGLQELNKQEEELALVISVGTPMLIARIRNGIANPRIAYPNLIDPTAEFWHKESLNMGIGNIICPRCSFSCNVSIGDFNLFNGQINVRHDVNIGHYNAFMPGVKLSGGVTVGDRNFFGLNSAVVQYHSIGNDTRIGAGSIVMTNTEDGILYTGIPAYPKKNK